MPVTTLLGLRVDDLGREKVQVGWEMDADRDGQGTSRGSCNVPVICIKTVKNGKQVQSATRNCNGLPPLGCIASAWRYDMCHIWLGHAGQNLTTLSPFAAFDQAMFR